MINELERIIVQYGEDGTQISKLPSNEDMFNKINEIIRYINKEEIKKPLFGSRTSY
jgi:hypothetical protein